VRLRTPLIAWLVLLAQACGGGSGGSSPAPASPKSIVSIQVAGPPVKVFDHTKDKQEPDNLPDAPITAWKEGNGTVNLLIPSTEAYRMRGPDLEHVSIDPNKIYSSAQSASQIPEDLYNYNHWLLAPYSLDGVHFFTVAHHEWYACLLNGDCSQAAPNGEVAQTNSWANTLNSFVSSDGGASWQLNTVGGSHVIANTSYHWTGSQALAQKVYLQALNHTGMFGCSRLVREGAWWYAITYYIHRDFSQINPTQGQYQAPIDNFGFVLIRTNDFTDPNGWQAWSGGSVYEPLANLHFQTFLPQSNGASMNALTPQLIFDTVAQRTVMISTVFGGSNPVYYSTTASLANPSWSDAMPIVGTVQLTTDPAGPVQGFNDASYPSILDPNSGGYNFEFTSGNPLLFYSTSPGAYGGDNLARDVYRVQLSVTYGP
jgi:hypothetical protein